MQVDNQFIDSASGHDPLLRSNMNKIIATIGTTEMLRMVLENVCDDADFEEIITEYKELYGAIL